MGWLFGFPHMPSPTGVPMGPSGSAHQPPDPGGSYLFGPELRFLQIVDPHDHTPDLPFGVSTLLISANLTPVTLLDRGIGCGPTMAGSAFPIHRDGAAHIFCG
jgi:hypothetical protein